MTEKIEVTIVTDPYILRTLLDTIITNHFRMILFREVSDIEHHYKENIYLDFLRDRLISLFYDEKENCVKAHIF